MNASPYFRYYAALMLILLLVLMLQVQAHAAPVAQASKDDTSSWVEKYGSCVNT